MSDEQLKTDGPRGFEIRRRLKAVAVLRARATASKFPEIAAQATRDADRLLAEAKAMAYDDQTAADFEAQVKAGGGVYFPSGGTEDWGR